MLQPWITDPAKAELLRQWSEAIDLDLIQLGTTADADEIRDTANAQPLIVAAGLLSAGALLASDHRGLPPALVLTAGYDPLRDEGLQYANALSAAGVSTQYVCFERQVHGFITMGRVIDEARTAVTLCASALRRAWGS